MAVKLGTNNIADVKMGTSSVTSVYLGTELVWPDSPTPPTHDYSTDYLTFESKSDNNTFTFGSTAEYSTDSGSTWTTLTAGTPTVAVNSGDTVMWKGNLTYCGTFGSTGLYEVYGNIMSLLYGDNFSGQTALTAENQFEYMFSSSSGLTSAENLVLPSTTLERYCYADMFYGCSNLAVAPELPATTLANYCYYEMFRGCTNLASIKCFATNISASSCTYEWVNGVAPNGTFYKAANMCDWGNGVNGIPNGWTVTPNDCGSVNYDEEYLTIESTTNNNTIYWRNIYGNTNPKTISASTDNGNTWTAYTSSGGTNGRIIATLNGGDKLLLKGTNANYQGRGVFKTTSSFNVYGNIMSLIYGDGFSGQTTFPVTPSSSSTFSSLFQYCTGLTSAENLVLPATTLTNYCYAQMFGDCTSLTAAPSLPATTLDNYCYYQMFNGCTSLTVAPSLQSTALANYCYNGMFRGCSSLTVAPSLPATTLTEGCYGQMFWNCTSLEIAPILSATTLVDDCYNMMFLYCGSLYEITCLATDISATDCTSSWVDGVEPSGVFYVPSGNPAEWKCGDSGVPSDWLIEDSNGDTYECTGGGEPSTDVPLNNTFAVKLYDEWYESYSTVDTIEDIEDALIDMDLPMDAKDHIEELSIGNDTSEINLDGGNWYSCTGLTLAPSVTMTSDIHNFPEMQWVFVMTGFPPLEYMGISGLFSDMNCCPIYVPEDYLNNYQMEWENETTDDCDGTVADRLVGWTYYDPNS